MPALTQNYTFTGANLLSAGITEVLISELTNKNTETVAAGAVTAMDLITGGLFHRYQLGREAGEYSDDMSAENGSAFWTPRVTFSLNTLTTAMRQEIKLLAQNEVMIIVKTSQGSYFLLGYYNGMRLMTAGMAGGKEWGAAKGLTLTFEGRESEPMLEISSAIVATLLVASA